MTTEQRAEILNLIKKFLNDNMGNRLNEWNSIPLLNTIGKITEGMLDNSKEEIKNTPLPPPG